MDRIEQVHYIQNLAGELEQEDDGVATAWEIVEFCISQGMELPEWFDEHDKKLLVDFLRDNLGCVVNSAGKEIRFDTAVQYMDDDLRDELYSEMLVSVKQEFFTAYAKAHEQEFGEQWELDKANPVW